MKTPTPNPIVPGNSKDRTGTAGILRRALAEIRRRFAGLVRDVLAAFDRLPVYSIKKDRSPLVLYGATPEMLAQLADELHATLQRWLLDERDPSRVLWWEPYQAEASQLGTAQSVANLSNLSPVYAAARSLQTVIYSPPYVNRLAIANFRSTEYWTGLAADQRTRLAQVIGRAVADGQNPKAARKAIMEELGVGRARAMLYAQTDITGALREARWAAADEARESLGLNVALLWTSALLPTTRPWHASRNGHVYSSKEVKAFYARKGERFNCRCAQTECLLAEDGAPILTDRLRETMAGERKAWQSKREAGGDG